MDTNEPQSGTEFPSINIEHSTPVFTTTPYGLPSSQLLAPPSPGPTVFTNASAFKPSPLANALPSPDFPPFCAPSPSPSTLDLNVSADNQTNTLYPNIKYWTKDNWKTARICAEDIDGVDASPEKCKMIAAKAREIYVDIAESADMVTPLKWMNKSNKVGEYFKQNMYKAFPELQYCAHDWKLHHLAIGTYPNWIAQRNKGVAAAAASTSTSSPSPAPPYLPSKPAQKTVHTQAKEEQPNTGDVPFVWRQSISQLTVSKPVSNVLPAASTARCPDMESQHTATAFSEGNGGLAATKPPLFVSRLLSILLSY